MPGHIAGIVDLDANFGGANIGIEDRADIADGTGDDVIGISVEANFRGVSEANAG